MRLVKCNYAPALVLWVLMVNSCVQSSTAWFDFGEVLDTASNVMKSSYKFAKNNGYCALIECCNDVHIHSDIGELRNALEQNLFGQHIAAQVIINAIGGHLKNIDTSVKPLVMSLHGLPVIASAVCPDSKRTMLWACYIKSFRSTYRIGTGKNFVAEHIARALYKKGTSSNFVHKYLGRIHFPLQSLVEEYKQMLMADIKAAVAKCPKSLFIFDEVEKMPSGLFDAIVGLLDHHAYTKQLDFRQSIFIFLSNVAGPEIANTLKRLADGGRWREETQLYDFESTLEIASYNLVGGLYKSELIESHVIDHFVPFLPLDLRHVESCIRVEYSKYTKEKMSDEILSTIVKEAITFDESGLYSNNGCKRVSKKVEALYYAQLRKQQKQDL